MMKQLIQCICQKSKVIFCIGINICLLCILQPPLDHLVSPIQTTSSRLCMHPPCIQMVQLGGNNVIHENT